MTPAAGSSSRPKGRARRVVVGATLMGFVIIFGSVLSRELTANRLRTECHDQNDVRACLKLCHDRPEHRAPCDKLSRDCAAGVTLACQANELLSSKPPRRRW